MAAKAKKSLRFELRLAPDEYRELQAVAAAYNGNRSAAVVSLIRQRNQGPQEPPSLAGMGKTENPVLTDQVAHRVFQG